MDLKKNKRKLGNYFFIYTSRRRKETVTHKKKKIISKCLFRIFVLYRGGRIQHGR